MDRAVVIRGLTRILTKADNHDNGMTYEVSLYRSEYDAIEEAIRLLEAGETDRITLKTALETDIWMAVYCGEPDREISVGMRYKDLVAIRKLIVRYCEEQNGERMEDVKNG